MSNLPKKQEYVLNSIEKISDKVEEPDTDLFNSEAINPTVETVIGQSSE